MAIYFFKIRMSDMQPFVEGTITKISIIRLKNFDNQVFIKKFRLRESYFQKVNLQ